MSNLVAAGQPRRVVDVVLEQNARALGSYASDPGRAEEDANNERRISQGGYGDRQVFELVQNGADEMRDHSQCEIRVVLASNYLYCANEGDPVTPEGAESILRMSVSRKRGGQIGRFGVGVKSVLAISDAPQFFSKDEHGIFGFGFHKAWARQQIQEVVPDLREAPVLRMARVLEVDVLRTEDALLDELLSWATTVVRLPLVPGADQRLALDLAGFDAEFLLFSPHVGSVVLEDRRGQMPVVRQLHQRTRGVDSVLEEERANGQVLTHRWRVFRCEHQPSPEAMKAAGELHNRRTVEIAWAVPEASRDRGVFWSYFPTKFATTLRGILNAPWKTSEDRQAIFDGNAFNDELLRVSADLVVDSLPMLSSAEDPGHYIDFLPGRGREASQWADERLTAAVWDAAAKRPSLVDQDGKFRAPGNINVPPEGLPGQSLKHWNGYAGAPRDWVHATTDTRERRARVNLILVKAGLGAATVVEWLEALVSDGTPEASAVAITIVADLLDSSESLAEEAMQARFVLTEQHGMVKPLRGNVYRRANVDDELHEDLVYVHADVLRGFGVESALEALGIREADPGGRLRALLDQRTEAWTVDQWEDFWNLTRAVDQSTLVDILGELPLVRRSEFKVRTLEGKFRAAGSCLLPGTVVPADGSRDAKLTVDLSFHAADEAALDVLGVIALPQESVDPQSSEWFANYRTRGWEQFLATLDERAARPNESTMHFAGPSPAGPLGLLPELSPEGRAAFLAALPSRGLVAEWIMQRGRSPATQTKIVSPLVWMARTHGYLETDLGVTRVESCVSPALAEYSALLPVAKVARPIADALGLPSDLRGLPDRVWEDLLSRASESEDDAFVGRAFALILTAEWPWPKDVPTRCRLGGAWSADVPDEEIVVTSDPAQYGELRDEQIPALLAPDIDSARLMVETWGMRNAESVIERETRYVDEGDPIPIEDIFPHLRVLRRDFAKHLVVRCSELEQITRTPNGARAETIHHAVTGKTVRILRPEDDVELLAMLDQALGLGLGADARLSILENRDRLKQSELKQRVADSESTEEKILALVGEDALKLGLPEGLIEADERRTGRAVDAQRLATLALSAHGEGVLSHHRKSVAKRLEGAPPTFNGAVNARRFVAEMGLPETFAGVETPSLPEIEEVDGPSEYPSLHSYQEFTAAAMFDVLMDHVPGRAMLQLPTGAGKTRVAVEASIRVVKESPLRGPILWIAQSEELCEQAVQSWRFVWSKVGPEERLTISRFWGGRDATPVQLNTHLVVTNEVQLKKRLAKPEYEWLQHPAFVLVDEAHRAISPTYTEIFEQLGLTSRHTARPLIGLSATPYRTGEDETRRLAQRFGSRRLNDGAFGEQDPYVALQERRILARVQHREIVGGTLTLSPGELEEVERMNVLPDTASKRLAADQDRNDQIIAEILDLDRSWPVLVFAMSVDHAQLLASLLTNAGVEAKAIDTFTPTTTRRQRIEDYRSGRIRVLTNYGVLAQGFDAPATRAVIIARPTYSPVVYQQMIGRGLRGPENGGKEECLILDVQDNIVNFGADLAFKAFDHLWTSRD